MTLFEINPAGAFINAVDASLEAHRKARKAQDNTPTNSKSLRQMAIEEAACNATFPAALSHRISEFLNGFKTRNIKTS
jgi:hypothetical protein